jgi:hypothetical protein
MVEMWWWCCGDMVEIWWRCGGDAVAKQCHGMKKTNIVARLIQE